MDKEKVNKLADILKRLNKGQNLHKVKEEAKAFLSTINASDLSQAEQKLIAGGLKVEDLRHLCSAHMEMVSDEAEKLKKKLPEGHVIHTMLCEHDKILGFLDELEKINKAIQKMKKYSPEKNEFKKLKHIALHLVHAEPHHEREEEIVFPELEIRGISGPPQIMRLEHKDLRRHKKDILNLSKNVHKINFDNFKKKLDASVKFTIFTLRDHIFKENNILYPSAVEIIKDKNLWSKMKEKCDKIGYCCFTPTK